MGRAFGALGVDPEGVAPLGGVDDDAPGLLNDRSILGGMGRGLDVKEDKQQESY